MEDLLLYFAIKYNGNYTMIYNALMNNEKVYPWQVEECKENLNSKYTTIVSKDYPKSLKKQYYPPFVLFYQGDLSLLTDHVAADFRCIDENSRFYFNTKNEHLFIGVENHQDLALILSSYQDYSIHKPY